MVDNRKGYRKLLKLRNKLLLNQINFYEFLTQLEIILYNDISSNATAGAGGNNKYCYSTIGRRLLKDPLGKKESLINLRIDLLYF